MKDHIKDNSAESYEDANSATDNYIYLFQDNNDIWQIARLTPNEYDEYCLTVYPELESFYTRFPLPNDLVSSKNSLNTKN